jgi:ABC-type polysaccharide/polyol phosphate export permease
MIFREALLDIGRAQHHLRLIGMLGWQDLRHRYRRSLLGPFWLTVSMAVLIAVIGLLFGPMFRIPLSEYLPYLAAGKIFWAFISSVLSDGCMAFMAAEGLIRQSALPIFVHLQRILWRNLLMLGHNILIFPVVLLLVGRGENMQVLWIVPGFLLLMANLAWMALLLAVLCTRYRDLPQMVSSALTVLYFLTPIMWMPEMRPNRIGADWIFWNPFFHLLDLVRAPLLGQMPAASTWGFCGALALAGWLVALLTYSRARRRIVFWL